MLEEEKKKREESLRRKVEDKQKKADEKAKKAGSSRSVTRNRSNKRPPTTDDEVPASKRIPVSDQPLVVEEGSDNQDLETQSSTVADGSTADDDTLRLANDNEVIDPNTCCMCFVTYEEDVLAGDGAVWIPCPCGRWLHEDCAEECVVDKDHRERYCPICINILSVHA